MPFRILTQDSLSPKKMKDGGSNMAVDMFLKLDGIKGESQDHKHKDEIHVLSWSWGVSQSATGHVGSGSGSGKANFHDISFSKYIDSASHNLLKHTATGKHIKAALLTVRKAGEKPLEFVKLAMTNCLVSSINTGGHGADDQLMENITLNFSEFEFSYTPQKPDGSGGAVLPFKFSIAENQPK
jgi:type VI secretion system secreted protein Hcp